MSDTCRWMRGWIGRCNAKPRRGASFCDEHIHKCESCGMEATRDCAETMGPFVCGANLCDECEHTTRSNGCNSGGDLPEGFKNHCAKTAQVYRPWYETAQI